LRGGVVYGVVAEIFVDRLPCHELCHHGASAKFSSNEHQTHLGRPVRNGEHRNLAPAPLVVKAIEKLPPGRALDLACGAGRHAFVLAEQGWRVTAVDASRVAIDLVRDRARERRLEMDARLADLEKYEFDIQPDAFDLICDCCYLQRDLFLAIRAGVRPGGIVIAIIHLVDPSPGVKHMNPEFLLCPGELRRFFAGWDILHDFEGKLAEPRTSAWWQRSSPAAHRRLSTPGPRRTYTRETYAVSKIRRDRRLHARRPVGRGLARVSGSQRKRGWTRSGARELERRCEHGTCAKYKVEDAYSWIESFEPRHPRKQAVRYHRHLERRKSSA
jgi:SAM-dependent methyltransferase